MNDSGVKLQLNELARVLLKNISDNSSALIHLSSVATGNSRIDSQTDLDYSINFLKGFDERLLPSNRKPKGNILVILSYNEPLLLSVIPIFCALAMGNKVTVRPSTKSKDVLNKIWQMDYYFGGNLIIDQFAIQDIDNYVAASSAVYFFGSYQNAQKIYQSCAKSFVEFIPEIEAADTKVINDISNENDINRDVLETLDESMTHQGKICQRISGVLIREGTTYDAYLSHADAILRKKGYDKFCELREESYLESDIASSRPQAIYQRDTRYVVIGPNPKSQLVISGYFAELLWIMPYADDADLLAKLNNRKYFLGLNIKSSNSDWAAWLINATRFSRYTLNKRHCSLDGDTGWGGNWPTGSGGYKSWYDTFSNGYTVIGK